jgi:hypothetical protein
LNVAIGELLEGLSKARSKSSEAAVTRSLPISIPALRPLPERAYEFGG